MAQRICSIDDCERRHFGRGWCQLHYQRWRTHGDPLYRRVQPDRTCKVDGCDRRLAEEKATGRGMCGKHYQRWQKHGDPLYGRPVIVGVAECSIDGCGNVVQARGWCSAHWSRWKRHGSPTARLRGEVVNGKRICPTCEIDKPLTEWTKGECKLCARERAAAFRIRNPYEPVTILRVCINCGRGFEGNRKWRLHCSEECSNATKTARNWKHLNARRARERGAFVERFDRHEIFERDDWICGICGDLVDRELRHPDPMAASLDHIIPVSRGGKHSRSNTQCSHWICNMRKGTLIPT